MSRPVTERLELLEWYDDFLKQRIRIQKRKNLPDLEIIKIYEKGVKWCEKTRLKLSREITGDQKKLLVR